MIFRLEHVAGFFDGEGSIGIYRASGGHNLKVQISQSVSPKSREFFEALKNFFGGNYSKHKTTHRPKYTYQIDAHRAAWFLQEIRPYLFFKAAQADVAIRWIKNRPVQPRKKNGQLGTIRRAIDAKAAQKLKQMKREVR